MQQKYFKHDSMGFDHYSKNIDFVIINQSIYDEKIKHHEDKAPFTSEITTFF